MAAKAAAKKIPEKTGAELLKAADSKAKAFFAKHEEANELYEAAAKKFQQEGNNKASGDAYLRCASITETKLKDKNDACTYYVRAAGAYVAAGETDEALKVYRVAVKIHMDDDAFASAAKMWKEISKLEEKAGRLDKALAAMDRAASCHEAENSKTLAQSTNLQCARIATLMHEYKKAIEIYEKIATASMESGTGTWGAGQDSLYKAGLCHFVLDTRATASATRALQELKRYTQLQPAWANSREYKFLSATMTAFNERNLEQFTNLVWKEDRIRKLDDWTAKMLLKVKRVLRDGPDQSVDVGGGADDSDIQDLLSGASSTSPAAARGSATAGATFAAAPAAATASPRGEVKAAAAAPAAAAAAAATVSPKTAAAGAARPSATVAGPPASLTAADDDDDDEEGDEDDDTPAAAAPAKAASPVARPAAAAPAPAAAAAAAPAPAAAAAAADDDDDLQ